MASKSTPKEVKEAKEIKPEFPLESQAPQLPKLNESSLSTLLGIGALIIIGGLIYNYFRSNPSTPPAAPTPTVTQLTGEETPEQAQKIIQESPEPIKYTVKQGDTLWLIAQNTYQSGYAWPEIAQANQLSDPNIIETGKEITLPKLEKDYPPTTNIIAGAKVEPIQGDSYTVVKGDDLWTIAVRAYADGYRWPEIAQANQLANPDIIHSGNVLTLPRP
jgi:nucleoid-associated protein YgaU